MKNSQHGFIGIVVLILLAAVVGGGIFYKVKVDPGFLSFNNSDTGTLPITVIGTSTRAEEAEKTEEVIVESTIAIKPPSFSSTSVSLSTSSTVRGATSTQATISTPNESFGTGKRCTDSKCFSDAIKTCALTTFTNSSSGEILGSIYDVSLTYETKTNAAVCDVKISLNSYSVKDNSKLTDEEKEAEAKKSSQYAAKLELYRQLNSKAQQMVGKSAVCKSESKTLQNFLSGKEYEFILTGTADCSGELLNTLAVYKAEFN